jgi:hypothetical protein
VSDVVEEKVMAVVLVMMGWEVLVVATVVVVAMAVRRGVK